MLTDRECRMAQPAEKDWKLSDAGGLHLLVKASGYKSWRLKYRFGGKEKQLTFGPYPLVSLSRAREMRDRAKLELLDGRDPAKTAQQQRERRSSAPDPELTFRAAALRWHAQQKHMWKPHHAAHVLATLKREAFPALGDQPIGELKAKDIRPVIDAMQDRGAVDQAHRLLWRISRIFQLAIVREEASGDPAAALAGLLRPIPRRKYPAIIDLDEARAALQAFEDEAHWPSIRLASRLLALTAARPGPLRMAQAAEFRDLNGKEPVWIIPARKMKLERAESERAEYDFTIPLAPQAVEVVRIAIELAGDSPWLFPAIRFAHKPVSDAALSMAYRRSPGFAGRHVPHGWRSTFSTIMNERAARRGHAGDRSVIDLMLAHTQAGVEPVYNRASYMPRRRALACEWAGVLCKGLVPAAALIEGPRN